VLVTEQTMLSAGASMTNPESCQAGYTSMKMEGRASGTQNGKGIKRTTQTNLVDDCYPCSDDDLACETQTCYNDDPT
jgi:hypothetical protein